jgi:hypothetical protein
MLKVGDIFQVPTTPPDILAVVGLVTKAEDASGYVEGYQMTMGLYKGTFYSVSHGAYEAAKLIRLGPVQPAALVEIPSPGIGAEEAEAADARAAEEKVCPE